MRIKRLIARSLISSSALLIFTLPAVCQVTGGAAAAKPTPTPSPVPSPPTVPSPPHERLTLFRGTWTIADYPPERRLRETCDWLPEGRRHMVCRVRFQTPTGPREGLSIFSYRAADSTYIYQGFRAGGGTETQTGHFEGDTWRSFGEVGSGATRRRTRVTITPARDGKGGYHFILETAVGDGDWKKEEEVRYITAPPER